MVLTCANLAFANDAGRQVGSNRVLTNQRHVDPQPRARKKHVRLKWHEMVIARDYVTLLDGNGNPMRETTRPNRP